MWYKVKSLVKDRLYLLVAFGNGEKPVFMKTILTQIDVFKGFKKVFTGSSLKLKMLVLLGVKKI